MGTKVFAFEGGAPTIASIGELIGPEKFVLLVPTGMLHSQYRRDPGCKQATNSEFMFQRFVRQLCEEQPLSGFEEHVVLRRAFEVVAAGDPEVAMRLRQDVASWKDALTAVEERGLNLADGDKIDIDPATLSLLAKLQKAFRTECEKQRKQPLSRLARKYIKENLAKNAQHVVMVGFTFFTPLQRLLIDECGEQGIALTMFHPREVGDGQAHAIFRLTYDKFGTPIPVSGPANEGLPQGGALVALRHRLFDVKARCMTEPDTSVRTLVFHHRHNEVGNTLRRVQELLDGGAEPDDIAIVVRDKGQYERLLEEEAHRLRLSWRGLPLPLSVQPRMLLLTPAGRFILNLYDIYREGQVRLSPESFERLLASGWLGSQRQDTATALRSLIPQWLNGTSTLDEWRNRFGKLRDYLRRDDKSPRSAATYISNSNIDQWESALKLIEHMCRNLFDGGRRSVKQHIERLLDELARLNPDDMRQTERELLQRIRTELEEATADATLELDAEDFSEALLGMVQQRLEDDETDEEELDKVGERPQKLRIATPEGFDLMRRAYVFYLGLTDAMVPRPYSAGWPRREIDEHIHYERYLFYSTVKGCSRELWLSYTEIDQDGVYGPSWYLRDACRLLRRDEMERLDDEADAEESSDSSVEARPPLRREAYTLDELAHYALCPYRYKLERLDDSCGAYRNPFQIGFFAQGRWAELIMRRALSMSFKATGLRSAFNEAGSDTKAQLFEDEFPGLGHRQRREVGQALMKVRGSLFKGDEAFVAVEANHFEMVLRREGHEEQDVVVTVWLSGLYRVGDDASWQNSGDMHREWLLPGTLAMKAQPRTTLVRDHLVITNLYHARQWWFETALAVLNANTRVDTPEIRRRLVDKKGETLQWIQQLESGQFVKNKGEHCRYCPAQLECLGKGSD